MQHQVTIVQDEDGIFVAEVPALPGCLTQGATRDEAIDNVKKAIEIYIESIKTSEPPSPPPIREEVIKADEVIRVLSKFGYELCKKKDGHIILRQSQYPSRTIAVPDNQKIAKGTVRNIIKHVGLTTVDEFKNLS